MIRTHRKGDEMYSITKNTYNFNPEDIFLLGKRANNPKRNFLFISKLLGKHLSVNPEVVRATGYLLSSLKYPIPEQSFVDCIKYGKKPNYNHRARDKVLVIGFCETATGLGMAVASSIIGSTYQTTTREPIVGMHKLLTFEESHSHATTHNMFSDTTKLEDFEKVILVDDEITTGNSLLNLIIELSKKSSIREFNIMTILDWRSDTQKQKFIDFEEVNNVKINVYSLLEGNFSEEDSLILNNKNSEEIKNKTFIDGNLETFPRRTVQGAITNISYLKNSGRFGVSYEDIQETEYDCMKAAEKISKNVFSNKILVLGHGENIYIPSRVASYLQEMGKDVKFRTTTLSPIYCDGNIIKEDSLFNDNNNIYHFYNKSETKNYEKVILLTETPLNIKLCDNISIFNL